MCASARYRGTCSDESRSVCGTFVPQRPLLANARQKFRPHPRDGKCFREPSIFSYKVLVTPDSRHNRCALNFGTTRKDAQRLCLGAVSKNRPLCYTLCCTFRRCVVPQNCTIKTCILLYLSSVCNTFRLRRYQPNQQLEIYNFRGLQISRKAIFYMSGVFY